MSNQEENKRRYATGGVIKGPVNFKFEQECLPIPARIYRNELVFPRTGYDTRPTPGTPNHLSD